MGGYQRSRGTPPRVAVGALAPRRRHPPEIYRRRRVTLLGLVALLVGLPWCVASQVGGDDGEAASEEGASASPTTTIAPARCSAAVDELSLRQRLALTLMVGVDGATPDGAVALLEGDDRPGGVFVQGGAGVWESGVLRQAPGDGLPLLVAVDDEGGRVQPMEGVLDALPSAAELAGRSAEALQALATERGAALRELGVNVAFAPVVDVGGGGGIGDRSFGDTSDAVVQAAGAYADGLRSSGVLPVLKHFPGHGHADADTHDRPATTPDLALLRTSDLVPYAELLDDGEVGVMLGHLDVPGLTEAGLPASLSSGAVGLLRAGYEFDGLAVTDDLAAMGAVRSRFETPEAAERALAAGVDLLLLARSTDVAAVLDRLEDAVTAGRIPARRVDAAVARVSAAGCPD